MGGKQAYFERIVRKRAITALTEKEAQFREEHTKDTQEELAAYVLTCAERLGHSPTAREVIGGKYIAERFESWEAVLRAAGLTRPHRAPNYENRMIFRQEIELQKKKFAEGKKTARQEREARQAVRLEEEKAASQREAAFSEAHAADTDEQLLQYLRDCAARLGHTPYKREVVGSALIKEHFVTWSVALIEAGLTLPKDMKPPKPRDLRAYHKLRENRAQNT